MRPPCGSLSWQVEGPGPGPLVWVIEGEDASAWAGGRCVARERLTWTHDPALNLWHGDGALLALTLRGGGPDAVLCYARTAVLAELGARGGRSELAEGAWRGAAAGVAGVRTS